MAKKSPDLSSVNEIKASKSSPKPLPPQKKSTSIMGNISTISSPHSSFKPATAPLNPSPTAGGAHGPKTRVVVKYDVGFNNAIYIRGNGANLSWDKGILLKNVKPDEWVWETDLAFTKCEFKVMINV
jgi:hypothetical protein